MTAYNELMAQAKELMNQADDLMDQADRARRAERQAAIDGILGQMHAHGLTPDDLKAATVKKATQRLSGQYLSPNGEVWTVKPGKRPAWVNDAIASGEIHSLRLDSAA